MKRILLILLSILVTGVVLVSGCGAPLANTSPTPSTESTPTESTPAPTPLSPKNPSAQFYSTWEEEGYIIKLGFNIYNGTSQTITVTKVEILDERGVVVFTMSKADIAEIWGTGQVDSGKALYGDCLQPPPSPIETIEDWKVNWYCLDAYGVAFTFEVNWIRLPGEESCH